MFNNVILTSVARRRLAFYDREGYVNRDKFMRALAERVAVARNKEASVWGIVVADVVLVTDEDSATYRVETTSFFVNRREDAQFFAGDMTFREILERSKRLP